MNTERLIVAKFGGSSLANAEGFIRVGNIVYEDYSRRIIVPSAPGIVKDNPTEIEDFVKMTDLLIYCGKLSFRNYSSDNIFGMIERRFLTIAHNLDVCIHEEIEQVREGLSVVRENEDLSITWAASRGEWLNGKILAKYLGAEFVDAAEIMKFHEDGSFNQELSYNLIAERLQGSQRFVVPGFYGQDNLGRIRTFDRGGSDITGAYLAAALRADIYENWTDVDGVYSEDPSKCPDARWYPFLFYEEMAELGQLGAKVLHPLAVEPVWERGNPINIKNTFNPTHPGTWIGERFERR